MAIKDLFQSADWKKEKHVPVIDAPDAVKKDEIAAINICVGKEIEHPNTTAHHISWIEVYFHPQGEKFPVQLARIEFNAHGASAQGADTSGIYTQPQAVCRLKATKPGTIYVTAYCNIHGLWENSRELKVA